MALPDYHEKPKLIILIQYLSGGAISAQVIVTVIVTLGAMVTGTIFGWSSPAQDMFKTDHDFPFVVTGKDMQTFISVLGVGALLGVLPVGYVSSLCGRKGSMILFEGFVLVGWVMLVLPTSVWMLSAARVMQGVGVGALCVIIPSYISEIAESRLRGRLGTIFQLFMVIGILYSFTLGAYLTYSSFCIACAVLVVLHMLGTLCIPESPYYLMGKNKPNRAAVSLKILRDFSDNTTKELNDISSFFEQQQLHNYTLSQIMSNKTNRKALLISMGCMFFQQISGINVVIFYMADIFNSTGSQINPHTCSIIVGIVQLAMTLVSFFTVDKYGRKLLLVISALIMAVCYAGLCMFNEIIIQNPALSMKINWLPLLCVTVYIAAFSIGYGPLPWVLMGEIYSSEVKPVGTSLTICTNWILMFVVIYVFNELVLLIGQAYCYLMFGVFCLMGAAFALTVVPETKNKTLAEIQLKLNGKQETSVLTSTTVIL